MTVWIASSDFIVQHPDATREPLTIRVGIPEEDPLSKNGDYQCRIEFSCLTESDIVYGADSLQALCLAMTHLQQQIESLESAGYQFMCPDESPEPTPVLFTHFGRMDKAPWNDKTGN
ncbi:MAG: DUF6968 family protein [Endozoicomonas sp.]